MTFARHFWACLSWSVRSFWQLPKRVKFIVTVILLMVYVDQYGSENSVYVGRVIHRHAVTIALISIQTLLPIMYIFCRLVFGTLYPAYASYKAVKTKNVKEYVKWMMYWIVFALFCAAETFADVFLSWIPFYYEIKIIFVFWLLSPITRGSSFIYRKFVHPQLAKREKEIDEAIAQARTKSYSTLITLGSRGLTYATNVVVNTAIKGQSTIVEQIKKSYSTNDLRVRDSRSRKVRDEADGVPYIDDSDEEFENRLRADNRELENREKQDHDKLQRRHLSRSKSDASERRPKRARPHSGLSCVEEVEHESSMAMLEKEHTGGTNVEEEVTETYSEEIIYYSPRKTGHYTNKETNKMKR